MTTSKIEGLHPAAPHHLPVFIPGPDGSDPLYTIVAVFVIVLVLTVGLVYFKLHALPEHLAEKHNSAQLMLISVLAILALFTHNNMFWVFALLIAVIRIPDFLTPLQSIAASMELLVAAWEAEADQTSGAQKIAAQIEAVDKEEGDAENKESEVI